MVGHVAVDHDFRRLFGDGRIHAIQLQRTNFFASGEIAETQGFRITRHEGPRGDHLGHVKTIGAVFLADHAERPVGHARHRRKHHRGRHGNVAELHGGDVYRSLGPCRRVRTRVEIVGLVSSGDGGFGFRFCHVVPVLK